MIKLPQIVILAGGLATRLRPLTEKIPKSLIEINGRPFILYQIDLLRNAGFKTIVLCVGYLHEKIERYLGDGRKYGIKIDYCKEKYPLGTAGALKLAENKLDDCFFLLYGDSYLPMDFIRPYNKFMCNQKEGLVVVYKNNNKYDKSNMIIESEIVKVYDKKMIHGKKMEFIDAGISILKKSALKKVSKNKKCDLVSLYGQLTADKELAAFETKQRFYEIGSFLGIRAFEKYLKKENTKSATKK